MAEQKEALNIVILGCGFAGQGLAHYFMRHIYPALPKASATYKLHLVDQSTHFWWRISAPRAIVSTKRIPHNKYFHSVIDSFTSQYPAAKDTVIFHHAMPANVDFANRTVTLKAMTADGHGGTLDETSPAQTTTLSYYALVIATGEATPTPLTSLHGTHEKSQRALDEMNSRIARASSVIIAGGGPVGVETAGEIAEALNGSVAKGAKPAVKVTLVTASNELLPVMSTARSKEAEKILRKLGVDILYNRTVKDMNLGKIDETGKTKVQLYDREKPAEQISADVYIPATGTRPNSGFLSETFLDAKGYINTDGNSLRIAGAGQRVYTLGAVGAYSRGGILDTYGATAALGRDLALDLGLKTGAASKKGASRGGYEPDMSETQFVTIGSQSGVAAFKGHKIPKMVVKQAKGKDFMLGQIPQITRGKKYTKA